MEIRTGRNRNLRYYRTLQYIRDDLNVTDKHTTIFCIVKKQTSAITNEPTAEDRTPNYSSSTPFDADESIDNESVDGASKSSTSNLGWYPKERRASNKSCTYQPKLDVEDLLAPSTLSLSMLSSAPNCAEEEQADVRSSATRSFALYRFVCRGFACATFAFRHRRLFPVFRAEAARSYAEHGTHRSHQSHARRILEYVR